jgi:hypothetical protein
MGVSQEYRDWPEFFLDASRREATAAAIAAVMFGGGSGSAAIMKVTTHRPPRFLAGQALARNLLAHSTSRALALWEMFAVYLDLYSADVRPVACDNIDWCQRSEAANDVAVPMVVHNLST